MGQLTIVYWRDIPSQVIARSGRANEKRLLPDRFQEAIDMAAMRDNASGSDAYLADWRRTDPIECGEDLAAEAEQAARELEASFDKDRLKALIGNGGREPA
jgi:Virulence factor